MGLAFVPPLNSGSQVALPNLPPSILHREISREEAPIPEDEFRWADAFALLKDHAIPVFSKNVPRLRARGLWQRGWEPLSGRESCYFRSLPNAWLFVDGYDGHWLIELHKFDDLSASGRRALILTFCHFAEWPVLCPNLESAAQLAEACFPDPDPQSRLWWHSYW